ncbi:hypothetical protein BWI93_10740 [Siphonobacter sp. BAB-5385]|uniref:hypothetical protein n=1 Tax=Siphonobacter sp. BAB-5385 TaxID=1864822 RepID=UPI000B9EECD2|nr:hypothetical protein [Siphonobacter sp. BAB-5385]OZI08158.1 hypothetical protein BWI93_10740 [Siphonobacter sp. BAB-5385]
MGKIQVQIKQNLSNFKQEVALAKFLHGRNNCYEKAVWRLLLRQYWKENGPYIFSYDANDNATVKSLLTFGKIMDKFAMRIIPMHQVLALKDDSNTIPLCYKSAIVTIRIWLRKT